MTIPEANQSAKSKQNARPSQRWTKIANLRRYTPVCRIGMTGMDKPNMNGFEFDPAEGKVTVADRMTKIHSSPNSLCRKSERTACSRARFSRFIALQNRDREGVGFVAAC